MLGGAITESPGKMIPSNHNISDIIMYMHDIYDSIRVLYLQQQYEASYFILSVYLFVLAECSGE